MILLSVIDATVVQIVREQDRAVFSIGLFDRGRDYCGFVAVACDLRCVGARGVPISGCDGSINPWFLQGRAALGNSLWFVFPVRGLLDLLVNSNRKEGKVKRIAAVLPHSR